MKKMMDVVIPVIPIVRVMNAPNTGGEWSMKAIGIKTGTDGPIRGGRR